MKKSLFFSWAALSLSACSAIAQGFILLDNYDSAVHPLITYGPGMQPSLIGTGLGSGWTVGMAIAQGDVTGLLSNPASWSDPTVDYPNFVLATGSGSTAAMYTSAFNTLGEFMAPSAYATPWGPNQIVTVEVIVYNGVDYASSTLRAHSAPFTMVTAAGITVPYPMVGDFMSPFSVAPIPEPTFAPLVGLTAASLAYGWYRRQRIG
jgi:hypothetical protein